MRVVASALPGCLELEAPAAHDARGSFLKSFAAASFAAAGLAPAWAETYVTQSRRGVVRGMHCQLPPHDHDKLVTCLAGSVLDVVLDLRRGSPGFGCAAAFTLHAGDGRSIWVPRGCAHGFCALADGATLLYHVTSAHAPAHDGGVRWDSFGFAWPFAAPVLSARDAALPPLEGFDSPFAWEPGR